ncbi:hypothetical protein P872_23280 [Rhodonellum psychrophilum GCM71 = DSM 17998]|uniref:Uncharacterized protein n=2 Tax=Rhodonellum TaxID=336827 RepID=U5C5A4_9BACT|nr:hypothetical protein P872_23280 [Rhodonellum psychrophilum GCM71 = DSM 17998]SDY75518.1 hypothetical protein SAMN05444412_102481 [Rhodonellum ikkaensis]
MKNEEKIPDKVKEPFTEYGRYSYADYLTWEIKAPGNIRQDNQ